MTVAIADTWHWIDGNIYEASCFIERNTICKQKYFIP
jgi:hypothetical protein